MFPQVMEGIEEEVGLAKCSFTSIPKQKVINVHDIKKSKKCLLPLHNGYGSFHGSMM